MVSLHNLGTPPPYRLVITLPMCDSMYRIMRASPATPIGHVAMTDSHQPTESDHGRPMDTPPGVPRWVKVTGIVVGLLFVVLVVVMLAGGNHGPGRHKIGAPTPTDDLTPATTLVFVR